VRARRRRYGTDGTWQENDVDPGQYLSSAGRWCSAKIAAAPARIRLALHRHSRVPCPSRVSAHNVRTNCCVVHTARSYRWRLKLCGRKTWFTGQSWRLVRKRKHSTRVLGLGSVKHQWETGRKRVRRLECKLALSAVTMRPNLVTFRKYDADGVLLVSHSRWWRRRWMPGTRGDVVIYAASVP